MTHGERLARMEAILESLDKRVGEKIEEERVFREEIRADLKAIRNDVEDDKADLAKLKNRGTGILIGVTLAAGSAGAAILKAWQSLTS